MPSTVVAHGCGRDDVDDRALAPLAHLGRHHARQPKIAQHIVDHHSLKYFVGQLLKRAVMRIDRRIAHQNVDAAPHLAGLGHQTFELRLVGNPRRHRDRLAAFGADRRGDFLAGREVAGRNHDPAAGFGQRLGDRAADAPARSGDDRDLSGQIEQPHCAPLM